MYITDIRHLIDASEKMPGVMPPEAIELIGFITLVIDETTKTHPISLTSTEIKCFKTGCTGKIKTALMPKTQEIHWYCPNCENEGVINNWQGTEWDKGK